MRIKGSGRGLRVHAEGYLQVTHHGAYHGWLDHRRVVYLACLESPYWRDKVNGNLPPGMTVDHLDHNRTHNCLSNLLLLDKRIHDAISWAHAVHRRRVLGLDRAAWVVDPEAPDWVNAPGEGEEQWPS